MNRFPADTVWLQATPSVNPMPTPGRPMSIAPYTSSWPGTVSCTSQKRNEPSQGKCGLASRMPPTPPVVLLLPNAQALLAIVGGTRPSTGIATDCAGAPAPLGGAAEGMYLASAVLLASTVIERMYTYSSTGVIGRTQSSPAHQPVNSPSARRAFHPAA